uniref:Uncharacterized protein n=1 Tax=Anguilla anguilla TaxID=7936 RepID=A0A0E9XHD9_ANGAN
MQFSLSDIDSLVLSLISLLRKYLPALSLIFPKLHLYLFMHKIVDYAHIYVVESYI